MNRPEWIAILTGCLACAAIGMTQPFYAIFLAKIVNVSDEFFVVYIEISDVT